MNNDKELKILAKTSFGMEEVLIEELKALGVTNAEKGVRAVTFYGNKKLKTLIGKIFLMLNKL